MKANIPLVAAALLGVCGPVFATPMSVDPAFGAGLSLPGVTLAPGLALHGWAFRGAVGGLDMDADGWRAFQMRAGDGPDAAIKGRARFNPGASGAIHAEWSIVPASDADVLETFVAGDIAGSIIAGGRAEVDGQAVPVALDGARARLFHGEATTLAFFDRDGAERLRFTFDAPTCVLLQDDAHWGGNHLTLRIYLAEGAIQRGREYAVSATVSSPRPFGAGDPRSGLALAGGAGGVTIEAGPDWLPVAAGGGIEPGSALDFSGLRPTGKPAGRFGRVVARGDHFEFEGLPGVAQRFYGVNLCFGANYPETPEEARRLAQTLARVGYNAIRIHHHDSLCIDRDDPQGVRLDEDMMRRMDALVAACAEEGLYISTDLFVSRTLRPIAWRAVGVDRDGHFSDIKCAAVHEGVFSNYLAFAANWICRTNSITGRRYADEPAIAWISLVNEGNLDDLTGPDCAAHPGWSEAWAAWLANRKRDNPAAWGDIPESFPDTPGGSRHGRAFLCFLRDVETRFVARTRSFLAGLGCRALLTDMNNLNRMTAAFEQVRADSLDYVDTHFYVDHPQFLGKSWKRPSRCPNENPFKARRMGAAPVATVRILGKPFTVSEYNFSGPGRFRGVGGIAAGACAALQDWSGLWRFAWSHELRPALEPCTRPAGYFDIASDPLQVASERASVCLFLRGDLSPLSRIYAVTLPPEKISSLNARIDAGAGAGWAWASWFAKVGTVAGAEPPNGAIHAGDFETAYAKPDANVRRDLEADAHSVSGKGESVRIDRERGAFALSSPRTCGGFAEEGALDCGNLRFEILGDTPTPATIWASSLDGMPLAESSRILLTHLTDVQNSCIRYGDAALTILLDWGHLPHLMRRGETHVVLQLAPGTAPAIFALSPSGHRLGTVPSSWNPKTGQLSFTADTALNLEAASFLYEIVRHLP